MSMDVEETSDRGKALARNRSRRPGRRTSTLKERKESVAVNGLFHLSPGWQVLDVRGRLTLVFPVALIEND